MKKILSLSLVATAVLLNASETANLESPLDSSFIPRAHCLIVHGGWSYTFGSSLLTVLSGFGFTPGFGLPFRLLVLLLDPVWWVRQSGVHLGRQGVAGPPQYVPSAARKKIHARAGRENLKGQSISESAVSGKG